MTTFATITSNLQGLGVYDFFLPFLLFLAITYGLLQGKKIISEEHSVNGVIAIAIAFFSTYVGRGLFYTRVFGLMGMVLSGLLVGIIFLALFGIKPEDIIENKTALGILLGFLALVVFMSSSGPFLNINNSTFTTLFLIIIMFLAVTHIVK